MVVKPTATLTEHLQRRAVDAVWICRRMGVGRAAAERALDESGGDVEAACDWLRRRTVMR